MNKSTLRIILAVIFPPLAIPIEITVIGLSLWLGVSFLGGLMPGLFALLVVAPVPYALATVHRRLRRLAWVFYGLMAFSIVAAQLGASALGLYWFVSMLLIFGFWILRIIHIVKEEKGLPPYQGMGPRSFANLFNL